MKRQGSRYDFETKAQALALVQSGKTAYAAARELGLNGRTVARWASHYLSEIGAEDNAWQEENRAVITRATELVMDGLDQVEELGTAHKSLIALNAIRGTSIDKLQRQPTGGKSATFAIVRTSDGTEIRIGSASDNSQS